MDGVVSSQQENTVVLVVCETRFYTRTGKRKNLNNRFARRGVRGQQQQEDVPIARFLQTFNFLYFFAYGTGCLVRNVAPFNEKI